MLDNVTIFKKPTYNLLVIKDYTAGIDMKEKLIL